MKHLHINMNSEYALPKTNFFFLKRIVNHTCNLLWVFCLENLLKFPITNDFLIFFVIVRSINRNEMKKIPDQANFEIYGTSIG